MNPWQRVEPLGDHDLGAFTCANPAMDEWVQNKAANASAQATATVWVCCADDGAVIGIFAFDHITIAAGDVGKKRLRGLPTARVILLARFALHSDYRGGGNGVLLMSEVMRTSIEATKYLPAALLVLDAKNDKLADWYQKLGFVAMETDHLRHYMTMGNVEASVALADAQVQALMAESEATP